MKKRVISFVLAIVLLCGINVTPVYASGRYTVENRNNVTGEYIVSEARKWAGVGATYWSGTEPWEASIYWRTGFTYNGQTSFDCSGFVGRVLNDCGFRTKNHTPSYGTCVLSQTYGSGYIGISIEELVQGGTDISVAVNKAKNGDYTDLRVGDIIGWTSGSLGRHIIIYAGLKNGTPWMVEFTGSGFLDRAITSKYQSHFQYGARYVICDHKYEGCGVCSRCETVYNWESTLTTAEIGRYKILDDFTPRTDQPYDAATKADFCMVIGATVDVVGVYTNAFGNKWYKFKSGSKTYYGFHDDFQLVQYFDQAITGTITSPAEGATIPKADYTLKGKVTSTNYPIQRIEAFLDGHWYAGVTLGDKMSYSLEGSSMDTELDFASLSPGHHWVTIRARDIHRESTEIICTQNFYISENNNNYTLILDGNGGSSIGSITVSSGSTVTIPSTIPTRFAYNFEGWATTSTGRATYQPGDIVSFSGDKTLYAVWGSWTIGYQESSTYQLTTSYSGVGAYFAFTVPRSGNYIFHELNSSEVDSVITLYDSNGIQLDYDDDGAGNVKFLLEYYLSSSDTYYVHIAPFGTTVSGTICWGVELEAPDYEYTIVNDEVTITGYTGLGGDIVIPSEIGNYPVTTIESCAFKNCDALSSVIIPDSVTTIGSYAFQYCYGLTDVKIGVGVTSIGDYAFHWCSKLTSVDIPRNVTTIGKSAFSVCLELNSATISDGVTSIGDYAFYSCSKLTEVFYTGTGDQWRNISIGGNNTSLIEAGIRFAGDIFTYVVENGVAIITGYSVPFYDPNEIIIPAELEGFTVTEIGGDAFWLKTGLTIVTIPDSVTAIGDSAFYGCVNLTDVYYNGTQTQWNAIDIDFLAGNDPLLNAKLHVAKEPQVEDYEYTVENGSVTITGYTGNGGDIIIPSVIDGCPVVTIKNGAFQNCTNLTSVTVPDSVTTIYTSPFTGCTNLTGIWVDANNLIYSNDNRGVLYNKNKTTLYLAPGGISGEYVIPDSVTALWHQAFTNTSGLNAVTIPASVTTFGDNVFANSGLSSVILADGLRTIGMCAFMNCDNLASVTIPGSMASFGGYTFEGCDSLTSVAIVDGVNTILQSAFVDCVNLTTVTMGSSVTAIDRNAFKGCDNLNDVYYSGTEEQWNAITVGRNNESLLNATLHFTDAPDAADYEYAIENGEAIITGYTGNGGDITIPSILDGFPVTAIDDWAFGFCENLTAVTIPEGVMTIGRYAFRNCSNLTTVSVPNSVVEIGRAAFDYCSNLKRIYVGESNTAYSSDQHGVLFNQDKTILILAPGGLSEEYRVPVGVTTIEDIAFAGCSSLTSVVIPDSVTSIGECALNGCEALSAIWVDKNNATYSNDDFGVLFSKDKTSLIKVPNRISGDYTIPDGVITIGDYAFNGCGILTGVTIADSVTTIGYEAFGWCEGLSAIAIPDSVTTIDCYAFETCTNLALISIADSVISIDTGAFYDCTGLTDVYYSGTEAKWNAMEIGEDNEPLLDARIHCMTVSNGEEMFATLQEALDAYETGIIQLQADVDSITVTKNAVVDLNGFSIASVSVTAGELTVLDSKTDDFTVVDGDYGKIAAISGNVKAADGYIAITEEDGASYHKVSLETTDMTLRSADAGIYFNCLFNGDEVVQENVTTCGVVLSLKATPEIGASGSAYSVFHKFATGADTPGTLLQNVMKETCTVTQNNRRAEMQVYGRAYIQVGDTYIYGETVSRSFREQVELVDEAWSTLTDEQKTEVLAMYNTYKEAMSTWTIPNIKNNI